MNKKFSTLVGCLAFGTAFSAVAQVSNFPVSNAYGQVTPCATGLTYRSFGTKSNATLGSEVNKIEADKWYQLRVGEEKNQVLIQERDFKTGEVTLRIVDANKAPLNYSLWQISYDKKDGATGGKFTFKNKETGLGIIFDHKTAYGKDKIATTAASADLKASILEGCNVEWSWFSSNVDNTQKLANEILYANFHDSDKYIVLKKSSRTAANQHGLNIAGTQVVAAVYTAAEAGNKATSCEALTLTPVVAESVVLNAKDINRMIDAQKDGAAGFNFMTPTGIGNRTAMSPEDNSTLDTYKYIAVEDETIVNALLAKAAASLTTEQKESIEIAFKLTDNYYDQWANNKTGGDWNNGQSRETLTGVEEAYKNYEKSKSSTSLQDRLTSAYNLAVALLADYTEYYPEQAKIDIDGWLDAEGEKLVSDSRLDASNYLVSTLTELLKIDGLAGQSAYQKQAEMARRFPIRLQAQIDADPAKNDKYLMVDTARWEEATENPSNSPELYLANKKPDMKNGLYVDARFNFRLTYFPTEDSLLIEPLNASVMTDAEYKADTYWRNSIVARQFISSSDIATGTKGLSASNSELATEEEEGPVAVMLSKLNTKDGWVVTAGGVDYIKGAVNGTLHTCIEFDHSYPYLTRTTLDQAVYTIQLVTDKAPNLTTHRANGVNVVADMSGHVVYDEKEASQNFAHMPATQWVVEYTGCEEDPVARVKVVNREYSNVAFEGQLYKADDNVFIINHNYDNTLGHYNSEFACSDTLKFTKVDPVNTLGYLNPGDKVIENTFKLKQFFDYGTDPYYLNAVKQGKDTLLRAQAEGSNFELVPVKVNWDAAAYESTNIPYGYTSEAAGATQLYKSVYMLKVKDADMINNDRVFVGINKNGKYCVADTLDRNANYTLAYFTLKENNHWTADNEEGHYYALVRTEYPSAYPVDKDDVYTDDVNKFAGWKYVFDDALDKLAIEQGQLDAKVENLCQDRTESFILEADTMPYYRRVVGLKTEKFYSTNNENRTLGESVIDGVTYMNIFSAVEEPERNNEFFIDTAHVNVSSMPTYLLALDVEAKKTAECNHEDHPAIGDHYQVIDYLQGRYMVDASVDSVIPAYLKNSVKPFENVYTRYAFVNAIHYQDTLYIMDAADATIKYDRDLYDGKNVAKKVVLKEKAYDGASIAFRLKDQSDDENFYIETKGKQYGYAANGNTWVKEQNHNIVSTGRGYSETGDHNGNWHQNVYEDIYQALLLNTTAQSDATANEDVEVSSVTVIAGNGQITVAGAAGKKVVITNILGQTVANTVVTSDNATIAAPAGVVVVAIEGEDAVKAIVK
ncbi:DUF6383 domain-containing protein [Parabacteroides merdae]|uniref:DUF6383 domain-containing protein n=2 Tax=Parabacteroides merdae TaxID=46503 RepID=UPI00232D59FD|nr:DUF6383 domain-containing protein [Parabacteroides merdae]MDB8883941.1 DUF6383 domain-containing protein [Parabacteroides merdae]MDB8887141.1 DUF6383 domain-containing protein [Parabacteroides merdae]